MFFEQKVKYKYDKLNRLVKETDIAKDKEICYTIDNEGNILTKSVGGVVKEYKYLDNSDKLVEFDGQSFVYDTIGNPTTYRNKTLVWENGRQLKSYQDGDTVYTYTYDCNALRTSKTVNGETTNYVYENGRLLREENSVYSIDYIYGKDGIIGIKVNDVVYLFRKNIFGDVTHIYDTNGTLIGKYSYTAYGECSIDLQENSVVSINPIRYRSYYYDSETNLYYLKSRYYDPETGRFITIDDTSYLAPDVINGLNLYAYCGNNPVMHIDPNGRFLLALLVGAVVGAVVGFGGTVVADYKDDGEVFNGSISAESYVANTLVGAAVGGAVGVAAPAIGSAVSAGAKAVASAVSSGANIISSVISSATTAGATATAGGAMVGTLSSAVLAGAVSAGAIGLGMMFAKDPFVKSLERGMSKNQKGHFQREIEDYKKSEGRGGADNLDKDLLREIAKYIKRFFK